jgi:diguanylate cyclase
MSFVIVDLFYGVIMAAAGSLCTWWLCRARAPRNGESDGAESRRAAEVLARLQDLTTRVAIQVDEHKTQVEEINNTLTLADPRAPVMIVDVVAKLIEVNQHMQDKLASSEDKLREQAAEIETHAAEARTDALTMLANRRAFDTELAHRVAEFRRSDRTFALVMADVDRFKVFNDTYGHQAGDEVLRGVARLFRRKMRDVDLVARYGGEEFAMILPETNLDEACQAAVAVREAIEKAQFRHNGRVLRVTTSLGVAQSLRDEEGVGLVARADKALYAAKEGGRNRSYRHDGETVGQVVAKKGPVPEDLADQQPGERDSDQHEPRPQTAPDAEADRGQEVAEPLGPAELEAAIALPSRSAFCQQVRNRTAEWKRGGPTFSVILIEVRRCDPGVEQQDRRESDRARLAATRFLAATVREMDTVGQYAPGCFAMLLPTAGLAEAIQVAERLGEGFSQYNAAVPGDQSKLAVNVGVVQVMPRDDSISLLTRAETALEAANRGGGDSAYCHDGECCTPVTEIPGVMGHPA